ncbi:hypothetical protein SAMN02745166_01385 [Prosthecobacter debontii]|uniref:Uncharacterized protein n=2 Tax=Prosthecobacter debontii TaxID=48467 RepID=A0A1T4XGM4_9BACT|nr:hypothetical protein SAMN02745166_01385 [Prosthecobacter debontii]
MPPGGDFAGLSPGGQGSPLFPSRTGGAPSHSSLIPGSPTLPTLGAHGGANPPQNSLLARDVPAAAPSSSAAPGALKLPETPSESSSGQPSFTPRAIKRPKRGSNIFMFALAVLFLGGFVAAAGWMFREPIMQVVNRYMPAKNKPLEIKLPTPDPSPMTASSAEPAPKSVTASSPDTPSPSVSDPKTADTAPAPRSSFDPTQPKPPRAEPASPEEIAALQGNSAATQPPNATLPKPATPSGPLAGTPPKAMSSALQNNANDSETTANVTPPSSATRELKIEVTDEAKPAADALMRFLTAKDLQERLKYTLAADMMKPLMERYYQAQPSGPVRVDAVGLVRFDPKPQIGGGAHAVFGVESRGWEYPVPVMLEETSKGFQVDWLSFVEFKDRLLEKFFEGYQEGTARFHVGITRTHYFEDKVPNTDNKDAFRIGPAPPNPYLTTIFVEKDSQLGRDLRDRIPWGAQVWAIVDLEWVKLGTQQWVQLASVPQLNWYSVPSEKKPKSGKTSELPNEVQRAVPVGR